VGIYSKRKGYRGEAEFAKLTRGKRVPLSGIAEGYKHDVILPNGWSVEVKRKQSGFKTIYDWLEKDSPDVLACRADKKPWIVMMKVEKFIELMERKNL
jgi:hypothetical protein